MAERKAVNKYYPPNWDPSKGSLNKFHGQHSLRDRARKLKHGGGLIVRFEMPFSIWCEGCNAHIGKGVRYNAEKLETGMYFSTKIYTFKMKCHLCPNIIEVRTDPENRDYAVTSGGRKKIEEWEDGPENGTIALIQDDERAKLEDPFYRLEAQKVNELKAVESIPSLEKLKDFREDRKDDYALSRLLRKNFREQKKSIEEMKLQGAAKGLSVPLLPPSEGDRQEADTVTFRNQNNLFLQEKKRKLEIRSASIFGNTKTEDKGLSHPQRSVHSHEAKRRATIHALLQRKL